MTGSAYRTLPNPPPPTVANVSPQLLNWLDILQAVLSNAMQGSLNVTSQTPVTLTPGATTTTIKDARIGGTSIIQLCPTTANAAAALSTTWITVPPLKTIATINHVNSALTDRTFDYIIIG